MSVILLLDARVSVSFKRLSNLNPRAEPKYRKSIFSFQYACRLKSAFCNTQNQAAMF